MHRFAKYGFVIGMKNVPPLLYAGTLTCSLLLVMAFLVLFFRSYFSAFFITEWRAAAPLATVLAFSSGINPYDGTHVEEYGNLYSVVWPWAIHKIGELLGLTALDGYRHLMFVANAIIAMTTAATAGILALLGGRCALFALLIGFTYFLLNTTMMSMGEFSYATGLACGFVALLVATNRSDAVGFAMALTLVTLASLFKVYFALFGIVVLASYAAILPPRLVIAMVAGWGAITALVYFSLTYAFPFYFDSIFFAQRMHIGRNPGAILANLRWFLSRFGFLTLFLVLPVRQLWFCSSMEKRRQAGFILGGFVVSLYVIFVMLPHPGNFGVYLLHCVAPIVLAHALAKSDRQRVSDRDLDRVVGVAAAVIAVAMMCAETKYTSWSERLRTYGIAWKIDLADNERTLAAVSRVLEENSGRQLVLGPMLAQVAMAHRLGYVDTGNRQYFASYINARRSGAYQPSFPLRLLASSDLGGADRKTLDEVLQHADIVVCSKCMENEGTHEIVKRLGMLHTSVNGAIPIEVYQKKSPALQ